jgi:hypothetical protein
LLLFLFVLGYTLDIAEVEVGAANMEAEEDTGVGVIAVDMRAEAEEDMMAYMNFIRMTLTIL